MQAVTASMCHLPSKTMCYLFVPPPTVSVLLNALAPFSPLIQRGLPRQAQTWNLHHVHVRLSLSWWHQLCWQNTVHFITFLLSSSHCPSLFSFILWARINCGAVCTRQLSELLNDPINYLLCSMERNFNCLLPKITILYVCKNGRAFGLYPGCVVRALRYIITQLIDC